jgi:hypothetical protein
MNDSDQHRYEHTIRMQTFGRENVACFAAISGAQQIRALEHFLFK